MDRSNPRSTVGQPAKDGDEAVRTPAYLKPPWWLRAIVSRVAPALFPDQVFMLSVRGRRTGKIQTTPVVVLEHAGERYLVCPYGNADWVRNLRAAGTARLKQNGRIEGFTAEEVPVPERQPLLDAYLREYRTRPTVARHFAQLPDPADHPTFRIVEPRRPATV